MKKITAVMAVLFMLSLAGCATEMGRDNVHAQAQSAVDKIVGGARTRTGSLVTEHAAPYIQYARVPIVNGVTARLTEANFIGAIRAIAGKNGYSLTVMNNVDRSRRVSLTIDNLSTAAAIREIALAAGYVAVIDTAGRTVTLAKYATATFRIPTSVLKPMSTNLDVGGNPVAGSGTGSSGSSGIPGMPSNNSSATPGGGSIQSTFTVNAKYSNNPQGIEHLISRVAGPNASVNIVPELGIITVRSNAQALKRVHAFLLSFARNALTRVQIEAAIVEVSLNKETQYGINWKHVLDAAGTKSFSLSTAAGVTNPAGSLTLTTASTTALINALRTITAVKIVSQPKLVTMNHIPAVLFDGTQVPYVPSVTSTMAGTSGTTQSSGSGAFATDGLSLSIRPDILNNQDVQISLVPVMSTIKDFKTFDLGGGGTLTMPNQDIKQSFIETLGENGKTLIIAGSRYRSSSNGKNGLPGIADTPVVGSLFSGVDDTDADRELIILLHTDIIPAPKFDPLVSESV
ncbi:MAG TPA: hypothetical protein DEP05_08235 [Betaproteobacteria bacterium]|nr:hypothetical protein [Betaproteobacteria bacterium]